MKKRKERKEGSPGRTTLVTGPHSWADCRPLCRPCGKLPLVALVEVFKVLILPSSAKLMMESLKVLLPAYNLYSPFSLSSTMDRRGSSTEHFTLAVTFLISKGLA